MNEEHGAENMERWCQEHGETDELAEHGVIPLQAASNVLDDDACKLCQKDISCLKTAIESEILENQTETKTQQTLLTRMNSIVAGRSVPTTTDDNDNANASVIDVDEDKESHPSNKHKSPAAMTTEAALNSQDVAFVAEGNQKYALCTQRKELDSHE